MFRRRHMHSSECCHYFNCICLLLTDLLSLTVVMQTRLKNSWKRNREWSWKETPCSWTTVDPRVAADRTVGAGEAEVGGEEEEEGADLVEIRDSHLEVDFLCKKCVYMYLLIRILLKMQGLACILAVPQQFYCYLALLTLYEYMYFTHIHRWSGGFHFCVACEA